MISEAPSSRRLSTVRWGNIFLLELPAGWKWSSADDVIEIFRPEGVGAVQMSVLSREVTELPPADVSRQLAESFIEQRAWDISSDEIHVCDVAGGSSAEFEFVERGDRSTYWQVWHVVGSSRAAFVTYTCNPEDAKLEAIDRCRIVQSLHWL